MKNRDYLWLADYLSRFGLALTMPESIRPCLMALRLAGHQDPMVKRLMDEPVVLLTQVVV